MIPYIQIPDWTLVAANAFGEGRPREAIVARPFGTLVALAVLLGAWLSLRQAKRLRMPREPIIDFLYWIAIGGFVGGHVLDILFYHPRLLLDAPSSLLDIASGQSSFGGFIGATAGACLWKLVRRQPLGPTAEVIASSFPAAWVVGRLGCTVAHDHPGVRSDIWLAVAYPGGPRLDLGLLEMLGIIPLAVAALWLRRRKRPGGYFVALMCLYYAPFRFVLDFFRARDLASSDIRYAGLTPAQWAATVLFFVGLYFSTQVRVASARQSASAATPGEASGPAVLGALGEASPYSRPRAPYKSGDSSPPT